MKIFIILTVLAINIFVDIHCEENEDEFRFDLLDPRGFRQSLKPAINVHNITFHGIVTEKKTAHVIGEYNGNTVRQSNGWYIYKNTRIPVSQGDTIHLWEHINLSNSSYSTATRRYTVPSNAVRVSC